MPGIQETRKNVLLGILGVTATVAVTYNLYKNRAKIHQTYKRLLDFRNPLRHKHIEVVETADQCKQVIETLKNHTLEYKVLGIDCEWVTVGGRRRPVALLQLASHKGLCALIRLCELEGIPKELRDLLEDEEILKVGVAPYDDASNLCHDFGVGVASTFDLRYLAMLTDSKPESLAKMSKAVLNVELDKNWRVRCSDWEAENLTDKQKDYAAKDALVAVEIFKILSQKFEKKSFWERKTTWTELFGKIETYVDIRFKENRTNLTKKTKKSKNSSQLDSKPLRRYFSTRTSKLYDNTILQAPDGEVLSTIDIKKAKWYLEKSLATLISENPFTVRLNFEPAGRNVRDAGQYYATPKENFCVVCGKSNSYIRKYIVPREYRKYFPSVMKSHTSHDVLLLCPDCHQRSNMSDLNVRKKLSFLCNAPYGGEDGASKKYNEDPELKKVKSAARALLHNKDKIPEPRREELIQVVKKHYPDEELTQEILEEASTLDFLEPTSDYISHGEKVVKEFQENNGGLIELEKIWRQHFLTTMKPKFLPSLWSVSHNEDRLKIRASEGRVEKEDLVIAGLKDIGN